MANKRIDKGTRALVLAALCEGLAINSVCRMFKVGKNSVLRIIEETGEACQDWHDRNFRNLSIARLELDETWAYVYKHKERMGLIEARDNPERGDCWLWAGMDADSKCIISWRTGKRTRTGFALVADLASRVEGETQITTDLHAAYLKAITGAFGERAHYAQELKEFRPVKELGPTWQIKRVDPLVGVKRTRVSGSPNLALSTICHMERFFLTVRQGNKRCARKTLAYSKKWENHAAMSNIHIFVYNMVRKHETLKKTPAMELGIADRRWTLEDVVAMTDAYHKAKQESEFEAAFACQPR